jgi:hypothetical protein
MQLQALLHRPSASAVICWDSSCVIDSDDSAGAFDKALVLDGQYWGGIELDAVMV